MVAPHLMYLHDTMDFPSKFGGGRVSKGFNLSVTKEDEGSICTLLLKKCY
jgi:hypothetical protein